MNGTSNARVRQPIEERFWARVAKTSTCWLWTGALSKSGYGVLHFGGRKISAHRHSWQMHRGPMPEGLVTDHLCRVRHCVNPDHLEPVTNGENVLRGIGPAALNKRKTLCVRGHKLTPVPGEPDRRRCETCLVEQARAAGRRRTAEVREAKRLRQEQRYAKFVLTVQRNPQPEGPQVLRIGGSNYQVDNSQGTTKLVSMRGTVYHVAKGISRPTSATGSPIRKNGTIVRVANIDGYVEVLPAKEN